MKRRQFLTLFGAAIGSWPHVAQAQGTRVHKIGFLGNSTPALEVNLIDAFRQGLTERGYIEGRDIVLEYRWADGVYARFPMLISELLTSNADVIVTAGTPASLAIKKATQSVPVVMIAVGDPVGTGLVSSLARPGGNLTGLSSIAPDLEGKRLELLREILPSISRVAMFINSLNPFHLGSVEQARDAAKALGISLQLLDVRMSEDIDGAFAEIRKDRPEAILVLAGRIFLHNRMRLMKFAVEQGLPNVNAYHELVQAGGLISFGPSYEDMHRRAATYVDKILKGTKPSELPIEQPTKFTLALNLKAAKVLGLVFPTILLARADEIIE